ncbi:MULTISPECIES: class I SAM-dependent methyltransferase [Halostella]|uniref:class I SAM-dependent methyltransferase n=1 Tax=Halostella TaxID=1843185 RepID=UPI001F04F090|nr:MULTISPECIES: methyltransferase domain-containing protein [Halostella]
MTEDADDSDAHGDHAGDADRTGDRETFASAESYYAEYRPGYGDDALRYLRDRFDLGEGDRVLDLGCGAGQIAVPVAAHVGEVVGMDPNEAMLREAQERADAVGRDNVEWVVGSDADLSDELGTFALATMGRSFHWMDQEATLETLHSLIEPGGGVAILNDEEWFTRGTRAWQDDAYDLAAEYLDDLPERTGPVDYSDDPWDELIASFGFVDVETETCRAEREWTVDEVVGYVFSLSFCAPERFANEAEQEAFEAALRDRLRNRAEETFSQTTAVTVITGRRE